jgi:serine/threonine protein kinase
MSSILPGLILFTTSGNTQESASLTTNTATDPPYDLLTFLGVAQSLKINFLPMTWQPALDKVGEGGTAEIRQALVNVQMSFAFKRLKAHQRIEEEAKYLRALIAEISVLGHPLIRRHPNVVDIEGICWDIDSSSEKVWPVLVFQKTQQGNLDEFMTHGKGKDLGVKDRLKICFDVAHAVRDLHGTGTCFTAALSATRLNYIGIIHGDIKPDNILIFANGKGGYIAKVTDFGYSTLFSSDDAQIWMPRSGHWTAPEYHHRAFTPTNAMKMDAYSLGMLCLWLLWLLCCSDGLDADCEFRKNLDAHKEALNLAFVLARTTVCMVDKDRENILQFFRLTLAQNPDERSSNFSDLLGYLSPNR